MLDQSFARGDCSRERPGVPGGSVRINGVAKASAAFPSFSISSAYRIAGRPRKRRVSAVGSTRRRIVSKRIRRTSAVDEEIDAGGKLARRKRARRVSQQKRRIKVHKSLARVSMSRRDGVREREYRVIGPRETKNLEEHRYRVYARVYRCTRARNVVIDDRTSAGRPKPPLPGGLAVKDDLGVASDPIYQHRRSCWNPGCSILGGRRRRNDVAISIGSTCPASTGRETR